MIAIETVEEERVEALASDVAQELGLPIFDWSVTTGLKRRDERTESRSPRTVPPIPAPRQDRGRSFEGRFQRAFSGVASVAPTPSGPGMGIVQTRTGLGLLRHLETMSTEGLFLVKDLSPHLDDPEAERMLREVANKFLRSRSTMFLLGSHVELPRAIEPFAVYYELELPTQAELRETLNHLLRSLRRGADPIQVSINQQQIEEVASALRGLTLNQARQALATVIIGNRGLAQGDIERLNRRKADALSKESLVEYYPLEDNAFELGGFARFKQWLERARVGFSEQARELNLTPPRGVLLLGVQGCGKSLAAKVIAKQWRLPLLKLEAGRLYDKYIGESERNFRRATNTAESMAPVVLWIDEIEKAFSPGADNDGGVSSRLFGAFLTWLQEKSASVFVVATANDISRLPPELLRKGRFDEIFFVDLPNVEERIKILGIQLTLRKQIPKTFNLNALARATEGFSGAEIEQAVISALYRALHMKIPLDTELLMMELSETKPLSVSRAEDVQRLRTEASGRFVPVR